MKDEGPKKPKVIEGGFDFDKIIALGGLAESSKKGYEADKRYAIAWINCAQHANLVWPFDWHTLKMFLADHHRELEGLHNASNILIEKGLRRKGKPYKWNSIRRKVEAIGKMSEKDGGVSFRTFPDFISAMKGMRRAWADAELNDSSLKVTPTPSIWMEQFQTKMKTLKEESKECDLSLRDMALIGVWFWSGGRRISELVDLKLDCIKYRKDHLEVTILRQKGMLQAQTFKIERDDRRIGKNRDTEYGLSPVEVWLKWKNRNPTDYAFPVSTNGRFLNKGLSEHGLREVFLRIFPDYTPHSLRATYIKMRKDQGWPSNRIAEQTGHRSLEVLDGYDQTQRETY